MRKRVLLGVAVAVSLACVGAPAALAAPTGGYAVFAQCPIPKPEEGVGSCLYASIEGGYITLGKALVPLAKPVVLQGGLERLGGGVSRLMAAVNGETLAKVGQSLPGGLFGLALDAVTELAAPASSIELYDNGRGELSLALPVKVRLVNPLLGVECSIGSDAHPIELRLTTGASGGLTGSPGQIETLEGGGILLKSHISMVSSGFAVPKAEGCGPAVVDEALDAKLGLPSSKNTIATFDLKMELASSEQVEASGF